MSYYRDRLQEAMLEKWKIENGKCRMKASSPFSILHSTFSILELVAYAAFLSGWLVAIITHL